MKKFLEFSSRTNQTAATTDSSGSESHENHDKDLVLHTVDIENDHNESQMLDGERDKILQILKNRFSAATSSRNVKPRHSKGVLARAAETAAVIIASVSIGASSSTAAPEQTTIIPLT